MCNYGNNKRFCIEKSTGLVKLFIIILLLSFPGLVVSLNSQNNPYKLLPFTMKRKPPQHSKASILESFRVKNLRKDIEKKDSAIQLGIRGGYFFLISFPKENQELWIPYSSLIMRRGFVEIELGYLGVQGSDSILPLKNVTHGFPGTISLVFDIEITKSINFIPKIGLGGMLLLSFANYDKTRKSSIAVIKPAIDFSFEVTHNFFMFIGGSLLIGQDINGTIGEKLQYYIVPNLGLSF